MIGALTALNWFANKINDCLNTLWKRLNNWEDHNLIEFFSDCVLKSCISLTDRREIQLLPLVPPDILQSAVEEAITDAKGFETPTSEFWREWEWWKSFSGTFDHKENLNKWYSNELATWESEGGEAIIRMAWTKLADALQGKRELVLYAQRKYLVSWFPEYDPASPDQLDDTDRPWDMDHIHPKKYISGRHNIPPIIKDWHKSIGNLRAWPMEANRADGEDPPRKKLSGEREILGNIIEEFQIREASFVGDEWPQWENSTPDQDWFHENYLAKPEDYPSCRGALIQIITNRWVALYREWYDTLLINELFK